MINKDIKIIISIGSNYEQEHYVAKAKDMLGKVFPDIAFSHEIWTEPIGMKSDKFLNLLAVAKTQLSLKEAEIKLKLIENACGREAHDKECGLVKLDLDILLYDEVRLHVNDWQREYVQQLLALPLFQGLY